MFRFAALFTTRRIASLALASAVATALAAPAGVAARSTDAIARGSCSATTDWKLKVGPEDGRLEIELEVDSNRVGQVWAVAISDNGTTIVRTTRRTTAPSGSFTVRALARDHVGRDRIVAVASNAATGERCRAVLTV